MTTGYSLREEIRKNQLRTLYLLISFPITIFGLSFIGVLLSSLSAENPWELTLNNLTTIGPYIIIGTLLWTIFGYFQGHKMILGFSHARPIEKKDNPELYRIVENASIAAGLPKTPQIYIIPDSSLNAFATGRNYQNSMVAISQGLLDKLEKNELEAVMAHEVGHILNKDIKVLLISVAIVGAIQMAGEILIRTSHHRNSSSKNGNPLVLVGFIFLTAGVLIATLARLAISREREYLADATSARLTSNPKALATALEKIAGDARLEALDSKKSVAALCIADPTARSQHYHNHLKPLKNKKESLFVRLFSTHPPISERINRLNQL